MYDAFDNDDGICVKDSILMILTVVVITIELMMYLMSCENC